MREHADEMKEGKDWQLYFSLPLLDERDGDDWRSHTMDFASMNIADVSDRAWLEDAVIEKIDKEQEGYFVQLNYNSEGYRVAVMNEEGFLPARDSTRPLDEMRTTKSARWRRY